MDYFNNDSVLAASHNNPNERIGLFSQLSPGSPSLDSENILLLSWSKLRHTYNLAQSVVRHVRTARIGGVTIVDYWWSLRNLDDTTEEYEKSLLNCHVRTADRVLKGALKNGGIYIKMGQGLATLNHVMPKEFTTKFAQLYDNVPKRQYREVDMIFLEDFGKTPKELFKEFNQEPIAAASLAQVHRALTLEGQEVAVKVQYHDVRNRFNGDFGTIRLIVRTLDWFFPQLKRTWIVDKLKQNLIDELDFEKEGLNSEICQQQLKLLNYVYIPKVFWSLTSKRVLTMEFIEGIKPTEVEKINHAGFSKAEVARKIIDTFNHQIFHTGFVHADPHPGNIMIRRNKFGTTEVVLLDHGLYTQMDSKTRIAFAKIWKSLILKDEKGIREGCMELGIVNYDTFSTLLTGKGFKSHKLSKGVPTSNITKEDIEQIKILVEKRSEEIEEITKQLPASTFLMFRNMNIIRSINRHLGTPVNRFELMARSAASGCTSKEEVTLISNVVMSVNTFKFDFWLKFWSFRMWFGLLYMRFMILIGRTPPEILDTIKKFQA